jgi:alpha-glucuronidase
MIEVRPLNPVQTVRERDPIIAHFSDSEWWKLIELVRQYGFEPSDIQIYYARSYAHPVEIGAETSQGLWEAISAVYRDPEHTDVKLRVKVEQLRGCAQIGAEHGGIEIRRTKAR